MSKKNTEYLGFCLELQGWDVIDKYFDKIPRYILFWSGYSAEDILNNRTKYIPKQKPINYNLN